MSHMEDRKAAFLNRFAQSRAARPPAGGYGELPAPANAFYASDVVPSPLAPAAGRRTRRSGDANTSIGGSESQPRPNGYDTLDFSLKVPKPAEFASRGRVAT